LLHKWQKSINLVAPSTLQNSWERHILDSLSFLPHIPSQAKRVADIGSGAGFPPLALAMARPDIHFTAIDSDERKVIFMQSVSRETKTDNFTAISARAEDYLPKINDIDVLTSRALAPLTDLISYLKLCPSCPLGVFTKGVQVRSELAEALKVHEFEYELVPHEMSAETQFVIVKL
jgi:16S rRNA (guanine527-N7)-methyltransferase